MNPHVALIWKKLDQLARMRDYLAYSAEQVSRLLPIPDWSHLQPDQHESLAAFRVRFSEFQEHMGKTMKAIAIEEEKPSEPFTAVLREFFDAMLASCPELLRWHAQLVAFCQKTYPR